MSVCTEDIDPFMAMLTGIDCLWMIHVSFVPGLVGDSPIRWAAELPPSDPHSADAAGCPPVLSNPLWRQSHGLCKPINQGKASQKFLVTPKRHRKP